VAEEARKALPLDPALVAAVRRHAEAHYDCDAGWDYVVETYEDVDIWEVIAGSADAAEAIARMGEVAGLLEERRSEIRATEW
jgi:hypothetical protein